MKPKYKTTLFHNKYVVGYHTNNRANIQSFMTNHFVYMDNEIKDVQWIAEQYLTHTFYMWLQTMNVLSLENSLDSKGDEIIFVHESAIYRHQCIHSYQIYYPPFQNIMQLECTC